MSCSATDANAAQEHVLVAEVSLRIRSAGLPGIGLASLLGRELAATGDAANGNAAWKPRRAAAQFLPKAKRVLQIFCPGGASHIDLWDYKPALGKISRQAAARRRGACHLPGQERQPDEEPLAVRAGRPERQDDQHAACRIWRATSTTSRSFIRCSRRPTRTGPAACS